MQIGKVSIIIPFYDSVEYLSETLQSIANQSYSDWECICVDDGSTDGSSKIVDAWAIKDKRFKLFSRPVHYPSGGNGSRNYGFEVSVGEYIQWFDSDDLMDKDMLLAKVTTLTQTANKDLNYVLCRTAWFEHDDVNQIYEYDQNLSSKNLYIDYLTYKTKFFTPGPLFRRGFLEKIKHFNVRLKRHQEREFFFRIILKDSHFAVIDSPMIYRRVHDSQLSMLANNSSQKNALKYEATCLNYQNYRTSNLRSRQVKLYFRLFFAKHIKYFFKEGKYSLSIQSGLMFIKTII